VPHLYGGCRHAGHHALRARLLQVHASLHAHACRLCCTCMPPLHIRSRHVSVKAGAQLRTPESWTSETAGWQRLWDSGVCGWACMDSWLDSGRNAKCPMCRAPVRKADLQEPAAEPEPVQAEDAPVDTPPDAAPADTPPDSATSLSTDSSLRGSGDSDSDSGRQEDSAGQARTTGSSLAYRGQCSLVVLSAFPRAVHAL
jgi:hypothetical protein